MLRDETDRLVGADRGQVISFPVQAPLRAIEKAWIHTCQTAGLPQAAGSVEAMVTEAMRGLLERRAVSPTQIYVLVRNGVAGRRPNFRCALATKLWDDTMKALEAEVHLVPTEFA
jgi:hypothetical protein